MKFYRNVVVYNTGDCIEQSITSVVYFIKKDFLHNVKNAAVLSKYTTRKEYYLNGEFYGTEYDFTKESWRRFCKLKAFL
jgi:hypothetical protein